MLGCTSGCHKYLYAHANPIYYVDPSGFSPLTELQLVTVIQGILNNTERAGKFVIQKKVRKKITCYAIEYVVEESVSWALFEGLDQGLYIFRDKNGLYTGKSIDIEKRLKQHGKRIVETLARFKVTSTDPADLKKTEQIIMDVMRKAMAVDVEDVRKSRTGVSNKIQAANKKLREEIRKHFNICK